jgi:hypothetical protein
VRWRSMLSAEARCRGEDDALVQYQQNLAESGDPAAQAWLGHRHLARSFYTHQSNASAYAAGQCPCAAMNGQMPSRDRVCVEAGTTGVRVEFPGTGHELSICLVARQRKATWRPSTTSA